jgi:hypothetical protein
MDKIFIKYEENCKLVSDINEHLPTLLRYAKECKHITEMGVRFVSSTWPLLLSKPDKLISYDIVKKDNIDEVISLSDEYNVNYIFIESDVLKTEIEQTELLFIDTLHTYNQLSQELNLHSKNVSKYIILHDTESFGLMDEGIYPHASELIKTLTTEKQGLLIAVTDFLLSDEGKKWVIHEKYNNNNGLMILKKKSNYE